MHHCKSCKPADKPTASRRDGRLPCEIMADAALNGKFSLSIQLTNLSTDLTPLGQYTNTKFVHRDLPQMFEELHPFLLRRLSFKYAELLRTLNIWTNQYFRQDFRRLLIS